MPENEVKGESSQGGKYQHRNDICSTDQGLITLDSTIDVLEIFRKKAMGVRSSLSETARQTRSRARLLRIVSMKFEWWMMTLRG